MKLQLTRPLVFFDLETTGLNLATDRIVEISCLRLLPDGSHTERTYRIKPTMIDSSGKEVQMPIPAEAAAVHGIHDEDVRDCPTFKQAAQELLAVFEDADLAGYNSTRFDVPLLVEEFMRAGIAFDIRSRHLIDAYTIFQQHEPRTLTAAYRFYCDKDLTDAHSANADTQAAFEVLMAQTERYDDLPDTVEALAAKLQNGNRFADLAGRISYDAEGVETFNFGKHKGKRVIDVFRKESSYYNWLMESDFPQYTKNIFTRIHIDSRK